MSGMSLITVDLSSNFQVTSVAHYLSSGSIVYIGYSLFVPGLSITVLQSCPIKKGQQFWTPVHTPHRYTTPLRMPSPPLMRGHLSVESPTLYPPFFPPYSYYHHYPLPYNPHLNSPIFNRPTTQKSD